MASEQDEQRAVDWGSALGEVYNSFYRAFYEKVCAEHLLRSWKKRKRPSSIFKEDFQSAPLTESISDGFAHQALRQVTRLEPHEGELESFQHWSGLGGADCGAQRWPRDGIAQAFLNAVKLPDLAEYPSEWRQDDAWFTNAIQIGLYPPRNLIDRLSGDI
ncbi:hypothetical protein [Cerasicoccus maritimus]|uniref:hypothetical protein n=1 Tax=Cerasicoccus maritimus TaxID=490089 RepID=UPI0028528178|nr:hypothetical protein [Cerasicoccus maritimus]